MSQILALLNTPASLTDQKACMVKNHVGLEKNILKFHVPLFADPPPPLLVHEVIEWPLTSSPRIKLKYLSDGRILLVQVFGKSCKIPNGLRLSLMC